MSQIARHQTTQAQDAELRYQSANEGGFDREAGALIRIASALGPRHERKLNPTSPQPVLVSFTTLIGACLFAPDRASEWLRSELDDSNIAAIRQALDLAGSAEPDDEDPGRAAAALNLEPDTWSESARAIERDARARAAAAGLTIVATRHLLAAAIALPDVTTYFAKLGIAPGDLREQLVGFMAFEWPDEALTAPFEARADMPLVLPKLALSNLSSNTRDAFVAASKLADSNRRLLDVAHLLAGVLTSVEDDDAMGPGILQERAGADLATRRAGILLMARQASGPPGAAHRLPEREYVDWPVMDWLREAHRFLRLMHRNDQHLSRNHLIAAAVAHHIDGRLGEQIDRLLAALGLKRRDVAEQFYEEVARTLSASAEDLPVLDVWSRQLRGRDIKLSGVQQAAIVADVAPKEDRLDFKHEARALALLASSSKIAPPLSIALFGDWGSGKSFFMKLMRDAVCEVTPKDEPPVVQIEFNAWHYSSGDVYAGLAHRIFCHLQKPFAQDSDGDVSAVLEKLQWAVKSQSDARNDLDQARKAQAAAQRERDERVATLALRKLGLQEKARAAATIAVELLGEDEGQKLLATVNEGLNDTNLTEEEREELLSFLRAGARSTSFRLASDLLQDGGARARLLALVASIRKALPLMVIGLVLYAVSTYFPWRTGIEKLCKFALTVAGIATPAFSLYQAANGYFDRAKVVRAAVVTGIQAIDAEARKQQRAKDEEVKKAEEALNNATKEVERTERKLAETDARVEETRAAAEASRPERRLQALVHKRLEEGTYAKHLGVIETLRDDFDKLSVLLQRQQPDPRREELLRELQLSETQLPQIRRIILYIDDLDRCPPEKVADVLQAVHLFLAFPLFVVVVAVDARWASQALLATHRQLALGAASPADYLEKIFQIPLWVAPMNRYGAKRILRDLWGEASRDSRSAGTTNGNERALASQAPAPKPETDSASSGVRDATSRARSDEAVGDQSVKDIESADEVGQMAPRVREAITRDELLFAEGLTSYLGRSPRRLKRFANLYRLAKASMSEPDWDDYDRMDHEAVLTLLALITGSPNLAPEVLHDLQGGAWGVDSLPAIATPRSPGYSPEEVTTAGALLRSAASNRSLRRWAPFVMRYSFRREAVPLRGSAPA
ncbi:MAG: hypothetical protein HOW73_17475 [Polyangiaceae bacterium]|nr:hypothetical protein [Polyangiaceae bacterium]